MSSYRPSVSVIIPAYNYADYLRYTLKNVLGQEGVNAEVIVVDDGSTDNTAEVAKEFKDSIHYIYQDNTGLSGARNTGVEAARGEFIIFLDADDLLCPGTLSSQCATLRANPQAQLSICHNQRFLGDSPEGPFENDGIYPLFKDNHDVLYFRGNLAPVHSVMLRTDDARRIGKFDVELKSLEDYDFWLRGIFSGYKVATNLEGLALYRKHGKNMSNQSVKMEMYECVMRCRIQDHLSKNEAFMPDQRPDVWLAHASRCFDLAASIKFSRSKIVDDTVKLGEEAFQKAIKVLANSKSCGSASTTRDHLLPFAIISVNSLKWLIRNGRPALQWMLDSLYKNYPETCLPAEERRELYHSLMKQNIHIPKMIENFDIWQSP